MREPIALTLDGVLDDLGTLDCALRFNPGSVERPWDEQPEGWEVYDISHPHVGAFLVGAGVTWQAAYLDALYCLGEPLDDDGNIRVEVIDDEHRHELERVKANIERLLAQPYTLSGQPPKATTGDPPE